MSKTAIKLEATQRDEAQNPRQLRASGFIPVSIYGKGVESKSLQINAHEFELSSRGNLEADYEIVFGKEKFNVKIAEVQKNYSINQVLNVEFKTI